MTEPLYRTDPYARTAPARVVALTADGGVILDRTLFYPQGGGQPGDAGVLAGAFGEARIETAIKGPEGAVVLVPAADAALPGVGAAVTQRLNWDRRHRHMRMHTALHLLSVVMPYPVTGGQIGAEKSRLDFLLPEPPADASAIEAALNALASRDFDVTESWISEAELDASPGLVKTMSVAPPRGAGRVRLVRIGTAAEQIDLQPCGGTHVARTGEIGRLALGRIENKGRQNRRVHLHLAD